MDSSLAGVTQLTSGGPALGTQSVSPPRPAAGRCVPPPALRIPVLLLTHQQVRIATSCSQSASLTRTSALTARCHSSSSK